jgi:hypothetical protein
MAKQLKTVPGSSLIIYALSNNPASILQSPLLETTLLSISYTTSAPSSYYIKHLIPISDHPQEE